MDRRISYIDACNHFIAFWTDGIQNINPHTPINISLCVGACLMDVLAFTRIFEIFEKDKMIRGPLKCRDHGYSQMKNVIYHGGALHSLSFTYTLLKLTEVVPNMYVNNYPLELIGKLRDGIDFTDACIEFDEPFDFFS
jgi:hypothetical protein